MKWGLRVTVCIAVLILVSIAVPAQEQFHTHLLAVEEKSDGQLKGSSADLYLELQPGSGRVFIDTFPLTKFDTQISTRFAKEVACDFIDNDCNDIDFIYTIKAG